MFTKGMRVEHKDVSKSSDKYCFSPGGCRGTVSSFPYIYDDREWVAIVLDHPKWDQVNKKFRTYWLALPEELIPLDDERPAQ